MNLRITCAWATVIEIHEIIGFLSYEQSKTGRRLLLQVSHGCSRDIGFDNSYTRRAIQNWKALAAP